MLGRVRVTANDSTHTIVTLRTASRQVEGVSQPENNPDEHDQWQDIQRERRCREAQAGEVVADCARDGGHHEGDPRNQQDQRAENRAAKCVSTPGKFMRFLSKRKAKTGEEMLTMM